MIDLRFLMAGPAIALSLSLSLSLAATTPAVAQQGSPGPGNGAASASAAPAMVTGRSLMTPEERATFRIQMQQAAPQDRQALWDQKRTELTQRAAERGMKLAEPGTRMSGSFHETGNGPGGREAGRGESPAMRGRMMGSAPRGL